MFDISRSIPVFSTPQPLKLYRLQYIISISSLFVHERIFLPCDSTACYPNPSSSYPVSTTSYRLASLFNLISSCSCSITAILNAHIPPHSQLDSHPGRHEICSGLMETICTLVTNIKASTTARRKLESISMDSNYRFQL